VLALTWQVLEKTLQEHWPEVSEFLKPNLDIASLPLLPLIGLYIFVVFGFLSRRCERQADIFWCRALFCGRRDCGGHESSDHLLPDARGLCPTGIQTFIQALDKVAYLNGISRSKPGWLRSWQHWTIDHRIQFLREVLRDPRIEAHFQQRVTQVKMAM